MRLIGVTNTGLIADRWNMQWGRGTWRYFGFNVNGRRSGHGFVRNGHGLFRHHNGGHLWRMVLDLRQFGHHLFEGSWSRGFVLDRNRSRSGHRNGSRSLGLGHVFGSRRWWWQVSVVFNITRCHWRCGNALIWLILLNSDSRDLWLYDRRGYFLGWRLRSGNGSGNIGFWSVGKRRRNIC